MQQTPLVASFAQRAGQSAIRRIPALKPPTTQAPVRYISTLGTNPRTSGVQSSSSAKAQIGGHGPQIAAFTRHFSSKYPSSKPEDKATVASDANPYPYLNSFLPEDSEIRRRCNEAQPTFFQKALPFLFSKSDIQKGCDYIEDILRRVNEETPKNLESDWGDYWGSWSEAFSQATRTAKAKDAVRTVLSDLPNSIQYQEFDKVSEATEKVKEHRKQNLLKKIAGVKNKIWERDKKEFKDVWKEIMEEPVSDEILRQEWDKLTSQELQAGGIRDYKISLKEFKKTRAEQARRTRFEQARRSQQKQSDPDKIKEARKVLGVGDNATSEEILKKYFELSLKWDPFVNKSSEAIKKFQEIADARDLLMQHLEGKFEQARGSQKKPSEPDNIKQARKVLGVSDNAPLEEIQKTYHELARKWHPDVNTASDATKRFQEISNARDLLVQHLKSAR